MISAIRWHDSVIYWTIQFYRVCFHQDKTRHFAETQSQIRNKQHWEEKLPLTGINLQQDLAAVQRIRTD